MQSRWEEMEARLRELEHQLHQMSTEGKQNADPVAPWHQASQSRTARMWQDPALLPSPEGLTTTPNGEKTPSKEEPGKPEPEKKWFEKIGLRGYTQLRFNEVLVRGAASAPAQHIGDRSVSEDEELFISRARLIRFGDISEHMYIYLQPDFVITPPGSTAATHFVQLRDW